jgi:protein-tyrosine phosphatase/nicotinamidase-related amidase
MTPLPDRMLITQCLQNDFVQPIGRFEPLPNLLHVGSDEATRLLGADPPRGPVARLMGWACQQPPDELGILHLRDWHTPGDPSQAPHLQRFGEHCLAGSEGARFVFEDWVDPARPATVVDSLTLNDFQGTQLAQVLAPYAGRALEVGLVGVWTEAKISFLAYELRTRFPRFHIAVCSALTASSSRAAHFIALDQLERLLGVQVFSSLGSFVAYLGGDADELLSTEELGPPDRPSLEIEGDRPVSAVDRRLLRYLFRDARRVRLRPLDGGFSGNVVLGAHSVDVHGHEQVPHVVKIGPLEAIGKERASFERVEAVLGNNAPRIADFVDYADRGALKYRYASMGGGFSSTLQQRYMDGMPADELRRVLDTVFGEQLGRFYAARSREACDLLDYYQFSSRFAPGVRRRVEELLGGPATGATLQLEVGPAFPNVCRFYELQLDTLPRNPGDSVFHAYVHGDLNGANIIIDAQGNVWLIDFFHTHRGHVLKDLIKLENDLLYIFTPLEGPEELERAMAFTDRLLEVRDLGRPLPPADFALPALQRAWDSARMLRAFHPELVGTDRDPLQLHIGMMRYAMHTMSFDECNVWQRRWALYTGARCGELIRTRLGRAGPLRLDFVPEAAMGDGGLALTLLPGRRDYGRTLDRDLAAIQAGGVSHVCSLLSPDELDRHGVSDLAAATEAVGLEHRHLIVLDQAVPSLEQMRGLVRWMQRAIQGGGRVLLHCVGGLGRSGTAAACYLVARGMNPDDAIAAVRRARSPRAIESALQERFVRGFAP